MTRRHPTVGFLFLLAAACVLPALLPAAACAAEKGADDAFEKVRLDSVWILDLSSDSIWVDSSHVDSIRAYVVEESLAAIPTVRIASIPSGFHPSYGVHASNNRGNTNMKHEFKLDYLLRSDLALKSIASYEKKRSGRADRESSIKNSEVELQYMVRKDLKISLINKLRIDMDDDQRQTIGITHDQAYLKALFIRDVWDGLQLTANLSGGLDLRNKNTDLKDDGSSKKEEKNGNLRSGSLGLKYNPSNTTNVEVVADLQRRAFSIITSGSDVETIETPNNVDAVDKIKATAKFTRFDKMKLDMSASMENRTRQFSRATGGTDIQIESTEEKKKSFRLKADGDLSSESSYEAKFDYSWGTRRFKLDTSQSSDRLTYGGEFIFRRALPVSVLGRVVMKRSVVEETYYPDPGDPDRTGDTDRGEVSINLSRNFWAYTRLRAAGSILMTSRVFVDSTQDKDDLVERLSLNLDYDPEGKFKGTALFSLDDGRTVNIHSSRSANNQTRQTWTVSPVVTYTPFAGLKLTSAYKMSLAYIYKDVDSNRNTMTRGSELRSQIHWKFAGSADLQMSYRFKLDESGSFNQEGSTRHFAKDDEGSNQKLSLRLMYTLPHGFVLESGQFMEVVKSYDMSDGKELEKHTRKLQVYNEIKYNGKITEMATLRLGIKQMQNAQVPIYTNIGTLRDSSNRTEYNMTGSLLIEF